VSAANDVRVELYRSFVEECRAPDVGEMSSRLEMSTEEVRAALRELADKDVIAFQSGTEDVWLVHPFCATQAPFTVTAGERRWDSICIWDALGILALIETDGRVETSCPDCGEALAIDVLHGEAKAPIGSVVHFGVPARLWYQDVGFT
jgi:hypothetical protein